MTSVPPGALPVAPLEYARTTTDNEWRQIVRGVLIGVLIWKGLSILHLIVQVLLSLMGRSSFGVGSNAIGGAMAVLPFAVVLVGAIGSLGFREKSRRVLLVGLLIAAILIIIQWIVGSILYVRSLPIRVPMDRLLINFLFSVLIEMVAPAFLYWMFTRRVVREMFH